MPSSPSLTYKLTSLEPSVLNVKSVSSMITVCDDFLSLKRCCIVNSSGVSPSILLM